MIERFIRRTHRRMDRLTLLEVEQLCQWIHAVDDPDNNGLAAFVIRDRVRGIEDAADEDRKLSLARDLLDLMVGGFNRQKHDGKTVYYTRWKLGKQSLGGQEIGICPVCGRSGAISHPNVEYHFAGSTTHVCEPFFMGESIKDSCDWGTQERRVLR